MAEATKQGLSILQLAALCFLGGLTLANGAWMVLFPKQWYLCLITPERAALFNPHFVIDVGGAYLTMGVAMIWAALRARDAFPLLAMSLFFSVMHGANHLYEYASFGLPTASPLIELVGIWGPIALLAWLTLAVRPGGRRTANW